jgi:hypothetical protein
VRRAALRLLPAAALVWCLMAGDAAAQSVSVDLGGGGCRHRLEPRGLRPIEHDAGKAVVQAGAHLDLPGGRNRRQVEHHDTSALDGLAHGDARRQLERQLARVRPQLRALEVIAQARDRSVQNRRERPPEAHAIARALLMAFDLDRRRPFEHQTAEAGVNPGAHRHRLAAVRGRRRSAREERRDDGQQPAGSGPSVGAPQAVGPGVPQAAPQAGGERTEAAQCPRASCGQDSLSRPSRARCARAAPRR